MVFPCDQWIYVLFVLLSPALSSTRGRRHPNYDLYSSSRFSSYNEENSVVAHPTNSLLRNSYSKARIGNKKFVPFVPTETFNDISSFIKYLKQSKIISGKREVNHQAKVVKCLQQSPDGVICFSGGKFYKFSGPLRGLTTLVVSQMIRDAEVPAKTGITSNRGPATRINRAESNPRNVQEDTSILKKAWKKRSFGLKYGPNGAKTFQEVLIQSHGLNYGPRVCYGFIAPEAAVERVHAPKCATGSRHSSKARISKIISDGNKLGTRKKHLLRKRSQILRVACRPLYIPTAKPSINEGRIARCRLPCGVHNCVPMQTCPCFPPCKTPAPPRITCEPEVAICCTEGSIPCPTRCPKYDLTDEPCPKFSDHPRCPFLTKPHCCTGPTTENPGTSGCNKEKAALNNTSVGQNPSTAAPHVTTLKMNGTTSKSGAAKTTGSMRSENQQESDLSRFGSRMMGLWPTFDLRKLLKSARYHNKENKVDPVHLADLITSR